MGYEVLVLDIFGERMSMSSPSGSKRRRKKPPPSDRTVMSDHQACFVQIVCLDQSGPRQNAKGPQMNLKRHPHLIRKLQAKRNGESSYRLFLRPVFLVCLNNAWLRWKKMLTAWRFEGGLGCVGASCPLRIANVERDPQGAKALGPEEKKKKKVAHRANRCMSPRRCTRRARWCTRRLG